eukprot:jgi/Mesen1/8730/ME000052S08157
MAATTTAPGWRQLLANAIRANRQLQHSSYCQLATVRPDGKPANRTIVSRLVPAPCGTGTAIGLGALGKCPKGPGGDPEARRLKFLCSQPEKPALAPGCLLRFQSGLLCWYFTNTREQFRILGILKSSGPDESDPDILQLRATVWESTSERQRLQFAYPPPGAARVPGEAFPESLEPSDEPLPAFSLLTLEPCQVDYLHLKKNRRIRYERAGDDGGDERDADGGTWEEQEVNP